VRALATTHGVTVPTIQRVIARLEALGIAHARQGSGVSVLDPARHGGLSLIPL
jgi:DNA-binding FadR family transcriptional regulator